jgi:hypothetical protein
MSLTFNNCVASFLVHSNKKQVINNSSSDTNACCSSAVQQNEDYNRDNSPTTTTTKVCFPIPLSRTDLLVIEFFLPVTDWYSRDLEIDPRHVP